MVERGQKKKRINVVIVWSVGKKWINVVIAWSVWAKKWRNVVIACRLESPAEVRNHFFSFCIKLGHLFFGANDRRERKEEKLRCATKGKS